MYKRLLILAPLLIISGFIYNKLPAHIYYSVITPDLFPGATLGLAMSIWFVVNKFSSVLRLLLFTICSFITYIFIVLSFMFSVAWPVAILQIDSYLYITIYADIILVLAGFIGALMLGFMIKLLVMNIDHKYTVNIARIGALSALPFMVANGISMKLADDFNTTSTYYPWIIWHLAVGLSIGWVVLKTRTVNTEKIPYSIFEEFIMRLENKFKREGV